MQQIFVKDHLISHYNILELENKAQVSLSCTCEKFDFILTVLDLLALPNLTLGYTNILYEGHVFVYILFVVILVLNMGILHLIL